jgi:hypothetical protein
VAPGATGGELGVVLPGEGIVVAVEHRDHVRNLPAAPPDMKLQLRSSRPTSW